MSYEPTTWKSGDIVTSTKLNKMEQGIANAGGGGGALVCTADQNGVLDHTWQEIHDAGFAVLELPMDENETAIYFASKISVLQKMGGGTLYMVTFVAIADDGTVTAFAFGADSADGYPVIQQG